MLTACRDLRVKIAKIISGEDQTSKKLEYPTVFHELLASTLPPQEKSLDRLGDEAQLLIAAGLETSGWAFPSPPST